MRITLDTVQIAFWSLAYFFVIIYCIKYHHSAMPLDALILNSAWEITALIFDICRNDIFIGHIVWFGLDAVILFFSYKDLPPKKILIFGLVHIASILILCILFKYGFMSYSVFVIDLLMAMSYLQFVKKRKLLPCLLTFLICLCECIGDLTAFLFYQRYSSFALYIGLAVQVLHAIRFYLLYSLFAKRKKRRHTGGYHRRKNSKN